MLEDAHGSNINIVDEPESRKDSILCTPPATSETNIAKAHLDHVDEKLQNKVQALKALQVSVELFDKIWNNKTMQGMQNFCILIAIRSGV